MTQQISQVFVIALAILSFGLSTSVFANNQATQNAPLRQAKTQTTNSTTNNAIEQAVAKRSADMQKRLTQLETANQTALAQNQELQLKNDNLTVQVQVLQSERSAQMFLYGAVTLGLGVIIGVILYNFMSTRRRRF